MTRTPAFSVQQYANWADLRANAPELVNPGADVDPFLTLPWFELLALHGFDPRAQLRLLLVRASDGRASLMLPMASAAELTGLSNFYSCLYGPVASDGIDSGALVAASAHMRDMRPRAPVIRLAPLDAAGAFATGMLAALRRAGYITDTYFCFGNWTLPVERRSYEAYLATRPGQLRSTLKRRQKKLDEAGQACLEIHSTPGAGLEDAITAFETVYRASWKEPEPYPDFIAALCRMAAGLGWLRLGVLRLDQRPVAAQLWLHCGGRSLIYKLAYDEAFATLSAGSLLTAAMMRHAIERDGAREIDYLSGDDAYKRDWMTHRRERIGIVAFDPRTARGLWLAARHMAGKAAKSLPRQRSAPGAPAS